MSMLSSISGFWPKTYYNLLKEAIVAYKLLNIFVSHLIYLKRK